MRSWREKESWRGGGGDRGEVPNDGNLSMLPSFANTDALSSSRIYQLPIACQPLTPSTDLLSESSRHSLGSFTVVCPSCHALHWMQERLGSSSAKFPKFS